MPLNYTKAIVICHGKSEKILVESIKQNLRIPIEVYSNNNGTNSIQISSVMKVLNNTIFSSYKGLKNKYNKIEFHKRFPLNIKIFIIMDTDDCSNKNQKDNYINKSMFKKHWLYDLIEPLYNIENLEDVLKECNISYDIKKSKVKNYLNIFPKGNGNIQEVQNLRDKFITSKRSNLESFITYCLKNRTTFRR